MGVYANRTLFRDNVTAVWWKLTTPVACGLWVLVGLGHYAWLPGALAMCWVAWQAGHAGVWVGDDDILVVHPVWGRRRVGWAEIAKFEVMPFNQWMIAWVITTSGDRIPCQGISSGRNRNVMGTMRTDRTRRVDVVVAKLNAILRQHVESAST